MKKEFEHDAVMWLAEFAEHWSDAPLIEIPAVSAAMDQFAAGTLDHMRDAGMTEGERICFGLGFMMSATHLHDQIEHSGLHDDEDIGKVCEATGMFAGTVAAKVLDPVRKEG